MKNSLSNKISIIVSSSDGYDDCWDPFFTLLKNYFQGIGNIEILLSTQTKDYTNPDFKLKVVKHGSKAAWSQRLRQTLEQSSHEIILYLDEDSFLRSEVNLNLLVKLVDLMHQNKEIGNIRIAKGNWVLSACGFDLLDEIKPGARQRFMIVIGLWKKEVLLRHLVDHETTWSVEKWATLRSNIIKDGFYSLKREVIEKQGSPYNSSTTGGVYKGRWIKDYIVPLFKENNIEIDFTKRGFYNQKSRFKSRMTLWLEVIMHPSSTLKSIRSLLALKFSK